MTTDIVSHVTHFSIVLSCVDEASLSDVLKTHGEPQAPPGTAKSHCGPLRRSMSLPWPSDAPQIVQSIGDPLTGMSGLPDGRDDTSDLRSKHVSTRHQHGIFGL